MGMNRLVGVLAVLAVSGCSPRQEPFNIGWLKVTLDTVYEGKGVHFVAYAECIRTHVSGGVFGATPSTGAVTMSPKSVGQTLPDGSFMALAIPELCDDFFASNPIRGRWERLKTPFVPFLVWSDRRLRPSTSEVYVAEEAYGRPASKFSLPAAIIDPLVAVPKTLASTTRNLPRDVMLGGGRMSDDGTDEIGDPPGVPSMRAALGCSILPVPKTAAEESIGKPTTNVWSSSHTGICFPPPELPLAPAARSATNAGDR